VLPSQSSAYAYLSGYDQDPSLHVSTRVVAALLLFLCLLHIQAMRVMNKRMNLPNMQKILMEFEKQNERMEMTSDMMGDAIDDAMEVQGEGEGGGSGRGGGVK
jgi:hypothetical protein